MSRKMTSPRSNSNKIRYLSSTEKLHWCFIAPWSLWVLSRGSKGSARKARSFLSAFLWIASDNSRNEDRKCG